MEANIAEWINQALELEADIEIENVGLTEAEILAAFESDLTRRNARR